MKSGGCTFGFCLFLFSGYISWDLDHDVDFTIKMENEIREYLMEYLLISKIFYQHKLPHHLKALNVRRNIIKDIYIYKIMEI